MRTYALPLKNKIPDIGKSASMSFSEFQKSDRKQLNINHDVSKKDKLVKEQSKKTGLISTESPSKEPKPQTTSAYVQNSNSSAAINHSLSSTDKGFNVTNQKTVPKNAAPTSKAINTNYNPKVNKLDAHPKKARKYVRFSPSVDVDRYDQSPQQTSETKEEESSDQPEQTQMNTFIDLKEEKIKSDNLPSEFNKEQSKHEVNVEIDEHKCCEEKNNTSNQEQGVEVKTSQDSSGGSKDCGKILNGVVETTDQTLNTKSLTETTQDTVTNEKLSAQLEVIPRSSDNAFNSENPSPLHSSEGHVTKEEANPESNKNPPEKTDFTARHENDGSQKKAVSTNSKVEVGSWSKGKSPLSKLFTSFGTERTSKAESKDTKKSDVKSSGLLGRLFQSSSEKAVDATKSAAQVETNDTIHIDDNTAEEVKEAITTELQKEDNTAQVPPLEQDVGEHTEEKSQSAYSNIMGSNKGIGKFTESSNLHLMITSETAETGDVPAPNPSNDQKSDLQSSETTSLSVTDTGIPDSKDRPSAIQPGIQASEQSFTWLTAEKGGDEALSDPFNDNIYGNNDSLVPPDPVAMQIDTAEHAQKTNEFFDPSDEEGRNSTTEAFFDFKNEPHQESSNLCGLSDSQEIFMTRPTDAFPSSMSDTTLSADASAKSFSLFDSQTISTENETMLSTIVPDAGPLNQDGNQSSGSFGGSGQTREENTDFDIFSSNVDLFTQPSFVNVSDQEGADASTTHPATFSNDIFGLNDVSNATDMFTVPPSSSASFKSLNDLLASDSASPAAPAAQIDLFVDDIFASEPQLLLMSEPSDSGLLGSGLESETTVTEQAAEYPVTNSNWMDDLLG
ncbi:hypothetical protein EXN66_Car014670 [Channa argus]|uniref:Uncharacterized protein n=1 Tax=Channa argus TaxID=215402 RepID=A0A6G1Q9H8_CHAAH|nr:hypothetical protein EXN66_Car014670 [Channa argus]